MQADDSFNTTMASVSLPSPAATSGWNSSISSDFGPTPTMSPASISLTNNPHTSPALPSYDSFDDPISGSRLPSIRSSSPSDEEHTFGGFPHLNVAGSRRSIDFQSPHLRPSTNLNDSSNAKCRNSIGKRDIQTFTYPNINNDDFVFDNKQKLLLQPSQQIVSSSEPSSFSSSIRNNISFSLPTSFNKLKR